jgi:hypothetical protein
VEADTLFVVTMVDVNSLTLPPEGSGLFVIDGFAYQITATRNGQPVTTFTKPLVFSITYTDQQIAGLDEASLRLYTFDDGKWVPVGGRIDGENNIITSSINHLSLFALLGAQEGIKPAVAGESTVVIPAGGVEIQQPEGQTTEGIPLTTEGEVSGEGEQSQSNINITPVAVAQPSQSGFRNFLASLGTAWRNLNKPAFFSFWGFILIVILILIGIKIWRKRKERQRGV